MSESVARSSMKTGLPPGSLIRVTDKTPHPSRITVVNYSNDAYQEFTISSIQEIIHLRKTDSVSWVNIEGSPSVNLIEEIGQHFNIHVLTLEDILNTQQRPKFEDYENFIYIVLHSVSLSSEYLIDQQQISILLCDNFVFTFKENPDNILSPVVARIKTPIWRSKQRGADYLAYAILDTIVDRYFLFEDDLDNHIVAIEEQLLEHPTQQTLISIQQIRREMIFLRRSLSPVREMIAAIMRSDTTLINDTTKIYFSDVHDHAIRIIEAMESYRELLSSMLEIYLSTISNRLNEIMKVLTVFSTIFIPLTFITGVYGMNFVFMPELHWKWAYPSLWGVFAVVVISLLIFFKRRKWF